MENIKHFFILLFVIVFSGCGGSGGDTPNQGGGRQVNFPDSPANVNVASGDRNNIVSWDSVTDATSYRIYWSTVRGAGRTGNLIENVTSPYQHTGLTNDTTYYYVVIAVNSAGESLASDEVNGTPSDPYATEQNPFDLGTAPLVGHNEPIPNNVRKYHYTLNATPGATYMFRLNNVVDSGELRVYDDNNWDVFGLNVLCTDTRTANAKYTVHCTAQAPASGLFYIRIGAWEPFAEQVTLVVSEIVNQGAMMAPLDLGAVPLTPVPATVLEGGESVYRVSVTPGSDYRVMLDNWLDSEATLSRLNLYVFDGSYTALDGTNRLCTDYGGNSGVVHKHRLSTIHCLASSVTSNFITIVTRETQYGDGATYDISVQQAMAEGTNLSPVTQSGSSLVYHGEVMSPDGNARGYSYYRFNVSAGLDYMIDLRGMHEANDLIISDATFTNGVCNSRESNLIDESCLVNSGNGEINIIVEGDSGANDTFVLSATPDPIGEVSPARYPDEGMLDAALDLGGPVLNRLSTVGAGNSYYSIPVMPGDTLEVTLSESNADVDLFLYADSIFQQRLCASRRLNTEVDSCNVTVPDGITTIYIKVDGQFTTNNGSWSAATEFDVGAMHNLTAQIL